MDKNSKSKSKHRLNLLNKVSQVKKIKSPLGNKSRKQFSPISIKKSQKQIKASLILQLSKNPNLQQRQKGLNLKQKHINKNNKQKQKTINNFFKNKLTKSSQPILNQQTSIFQNCQIKKSIYLQTSQNQNNTHINNQNNDQINNQLNNLKSTINQISKTNDDNINTRKCTDQQRKQIYYGNTTSSYTKSTKKQNQKQKKHKHEKQLSVRSKQGSYWQRQGQKYQKSLQPSLLSPKDKKPTHEIIKKQIKKKISSSNSYYKISKPTSPIHIQNSSILILEQKLQIKQANLNTLKTKHILQLTKGIGGYVDQLKDQQLKRLTKIIKLEQSILQKQVQLLKTQLQSLKSQRFGFGQEQVSRWIDSRYNV